MAVTLVFGAAAPVAGASESPPEFVVALDADGSATVEMRAAFDLDREAERDAFEALRADAEARNATAAAFEDRVQSVATAAEESTDREMRVSTAEMRLRTTNGGDTGVVTLSARWSGLAAVEGDRLVVSEPFASESTPERPFRLVAPEGYEVDAAAPAPSETGSDAVAWDAGSDLAGFEVTFVRSSTDGSVERPSESVDDGVASSTEVPGFGVLVGAGSVILATLAAARRQ